MKPIDERVREKMRGNGPVFIDDLWRTKPARKVVEPGGLAGWVLGFLRKQQVKTANRRMQVVETVALGGRRQLMLVECDGERFLVGSGADRVDTIVRIGDAAVKATEETWI